MDRKKGWNRKEVHTIEPSDFLSGGEHANLYGRGKDHGKHASAWGKDRKSATENVYKKWREKYK